MVCLCLAGGRLTPQDSDIKQKLEEAGRLHAKGDAAAAVILYREILGRAPRETEALHMMGVIAQQGGNAALALKFFEAALAADPDFARAWYNRGVVLAATGRNDDALQSLRAATGCDPMLGEAWDMTGQILKNGGDYAAADESHKRALALQPGNPRFHDNYAALLFACGKTRDALRAARRAEALSAGYKPAAMGNILKSMGRTGEALPYFAALRAQMPGNAEAAANEAMALLQTGDWAHGWKLWEQRPGFDAATTALPVWRGERTAHLLLYEDQGLGDAVQFLRYIPFMKERSARITLRLRAPLQKLCAANFPDVAVIDEQTALPDAVSARCRLSSLPALFETRLDTVPPAPYLRADEKACASWRDRIKTVAAPRIGLVWAGGAQFRNDAARSIDPALLRPLIEGRTAHFVSLQKDRDAKINGIHDAAPELHDFADSAALIAALDLVITVDTAIAHLAGALGKPVWIMLPFDADWRWLLGREDSPWYSAARLFRQKTPGDWGEVIARATNEAEKLIGGDKTVLAPARWTGESLRHNPDALPLPP